MTVSKEQAQAALNWFNKANWNPNVQEVQTIRTVLQERLEQFPVDNNGYKYSQPYPVNGFTIEGERSKPPQPSEALDALDWFYYMLDDNAPEDDDLSDRFDRVSAYNKIRKALQRNDVPQDKCQQCNGDGVVVTTEPDCCGNTDWECKGHCAVPKEVQRQCSNCAGIGHYNGIKEKLDAVENQCGYLTSSIQVLRAAMLAAAPKAGE